MSLSPETVFGQYQVISQLGAGGMGEVFLAEDARLGRKVALKILPAKFSVDSERLERFVREARAASALNHPNIITVYEIGEFEGTNFMAVEYIDGQTLRGRMSAGKMTFDDILSICIQTAEALSAAHQAGIIHRDIKPENIMIRPDGYVKVLDFGLAKLSEKHEETGSPEQSTKKLMQTEPGMMMGTAAYMSPEQARGKPVDARSDVFSFGIVMYEVLAGCLPFNGETMIDLLASIINTEPPPLSTRAGHLPKELQRIVHKSLKKEAGERYQSTKELLNDLKDLRDELRLESKLEQSAVPHITQAKRDSSTGVSTTTGSNKDAILLTEFENTTGDPIFDQTLKAALAFSLAQSPVLDIYPDSKVNQALTMMGREANEPVTKELGSEIAVRRGLKAYIAGTIARFGTQFVLTLEAINAQTGESLGREFEHVPSQDEVLTAISRAATGLREKLGESLSSIERHDMPEYVTTPSLDALKYFVHGQEASFVGKPLEAIPFMLKAIECDPKFAIGWVMLGYNYANIDQWKQASDAISNAYEFRDSVSEPERFRIDYAYYKLVTGEMDKAIETLELWGKTYPWIGGIPMSLADCYMKIGKWKNAIAVLRERGGLERNDVAVSYVNLIESLTAIGNYSEAKSFYQTAQQKGFVGYYFQLPIAIIAFIEGDADVLKQQIDWFKGRNEEYFGIDVQTGIAAFRGQWRKTKELSKHAIDAAVRSEAYEVAAQFAADQALRIVFWSSGNGMPDSANKQLQTAVKTQVANALKLERSKASLAAAALVFSVAGQADDAQVLYDELRRDHPKNTLLNDLWLPAVRAALCLQSSKAKEAIEELEVAERFERAAKFYPQYIRGLAYLSLDKMAQAAGEFDKILDHLGEGPLSSIYPLAQLGKARASKSRAEYEKFFELWKDADSDMPAMAAAKKEYDELKAEHDR